MKSDRELRWSYGKGSYEGVMSNEYGRTGLEGGIKEKRRRTGEIKYHMWQECRTRGEKGFKGYEQNIPERLKTRERCLHLCVCAYRSPALCSLRVCKGLATVISRVAWAVKLQQQQPKESDSSSKVSKRSGRQLSVWRTHTHIDITVWKKTTITYSALQVLSAGFCRSLCTDMVSFQLGIPVSLDILLKDNTFWMQNIVAPHKRGKFFDHPWVAWKQNYFPSQITNTLATLTWSGWDRRVRSDVPNTE